MTLLAISDLRTTGVMSLQGKEGAILTDGARDGCILLLGLDEGTLVGTDDGDTDGIVDGNGEGNAEGVDDGNEILGAVGPNAGGREGPTLG
jgi:hypothetical protein